MSSMGVDGVWHRALQVCSEGRLLALSCELLLLGLWLWVPVSPHDTAVSSLIRLSQSLRASPHFTEFKKTPTPECYYCPTESVCRPPPPLHPGARCPS